MKRLFILVTYSVVWLFFGYLIGNINTIEAQGQRDRLADYIHQYMDDQAAYENYLTRAALFNNVDSVEPPTSLENAIEQWQLEDNAAGDLGFRMDLDEWCFAY